MRMSFKHRCNLLLVCDFLRHFFPREQSTFRWSSQSLSEYFANEKVLWNWCTSTLPTAFREDYFFPGTALSTSLSRSTRSALYLDETLVDFPSFTKIMYNHVWKRKDVACKKTWFFFNWPWLILYIQLNNFPRQCLIWAYSFISDRLSDIEPAIFFYDCVAKQRFPSVKPVDHVFSVIEF